MSGPLVTVVVPCFNMGPCLLETIASIQGQTYEAIEIIVVDDGSTDDETQSGLTVVENMPDVRVVRQANAGVAGAINVGVRTGSGTYFMPLGDDLIDPPYIAEAVEVMETDPNVGIVYCRADYFGSMSGPWHLPDFEMSGQLVRNQIHAVSLFRRADWEAVGGYDEELRGLEDWDFNLRILGLGRSVRRLDGVYFHYRRGRPSTNDAISNLANRDQMIATHARIFRNNHELYAEHADDYMKAIFEASDRHDLLAHRYRRLERFRASSPGRWLAKALRPLRGYR